MRGLLALITLLAAFAVVVAFTATGDGRKAATPALLVRATPPGPTATPPSPPSGIPLSSGNMFAGPPILLPPVPTAEPGREGPETTLVEVATGRSLRLWAPGEVIVRPTFSPDGKWLVYDRSKDNIGSLYRVDLGQADLKATLYSDGLGPAFSSGNELAFLTSRRDSLTQGGYDVRVLTASGTVRTLPPSAYGLPVWSPDGRWLAYVAPSGSPGIGQPIALMAYDSKSGTTHKLGEGAPVQGDYRLGPEWSPTGRYVSQAFSDGLSLNRRVLSPTDAGFVLDVPSRAVWAASKDLMVGFDDKTKSYVAIDVASKQSRALPLQGAEYIEPVFSPDNSVLGIMREARPEGPTAGMRFASLETGTDLFEVSGMLSAWSSDGSSFLMTISPDCMQGFSLRDAATGALSRCLDQTVAAKFSPSGRQVAYVKPESYSNDPRFIETRSNDLYVMDLKAQQERKVLTDARGPLGCLYWSPDERWVVLSAICDGR